VVDEPNQENLHVVEEPMASPNVLIENENNAMLAYYAKKIGLAMKGITVSICEKSRCKNNDNIGKIVLDGFIKHS
jgi:hypothetical protein